MNTTPVAKLSAWRAQLREPAAAADSGLVEVSVEVISAVVQMLLVPVQRQTMFDPNSTLASDMQNVDVWLLSWADADGRRFNGQYFPATPSGDGAPSLFVTYDRCSGFVWGGLGDEWLLVTLAGHGISALCINALPLDLNAVVRFEIGRSAVEFVRQS